MPATARAHLITLSVIQAFKSQRRAAAQSTTVVGQHQGTVGAPTGSQYGFSVTQEGYSADKSGKDNNYRGETIFNNTLYVTKGSGSNGINTVYQVGQAGTLPTAGTAASTTFSILPGFPTGLAKRLESAASFRHLVRQRHDAVRGRRGQPETDR